MDPEKRIKEFRIALGGVSATPLRISKVEQAIEGQDLNFGLIKELSKLLEKELQPLSDLRGSAEYRRLMASVLLTRFLKSLLGESRMDVRAQT